MSEKRPPAVETFRRNVSTTPHQSPNIPLYPAQRAVPEALRVPTGTLRFRGYRTESARLRGWDYQGDGVYFVTICTLNREHWLSAVVEGQVQLTPAGRIVDEEWRNTPLVRPYVDLDQYVVMPNHVHGILRVRDRHPLVRSVGSGAAAAETSHRDVSTATVARLRPGSLGAIMGQFKSLCTKRIREAAEPGFGWQPRFYDHMIRDEDELNRVQQYIFQNPLKLDLTEDIPANLWM